MTKITKAVIPIAGYGTRFLPFTKAIPKAMLPVLNKPSIQLITEEVVNSGITDILFIVGYKKEIIENHFSIAEKLENKLLSAGKTDFYQSIKYPEKMANITFKVQDTLNGTGGAIQMAKEFVKDEPFAVLFGDDVIFSDSKPVLKQLIDVYDQTGKTIVGCQFVDKEDVPLYATIEYTSKQGNIYNVSRIIEKPDIQNVNSELAPLGRYIITPKTMDYIMCLKPSKKNNELQLTDALDIASQNGEALAIEFDGLRYDMGNIFGFLKANIEYGLKDKEISSKLREYLKELIK